jgi:hypothetical protein
VAFRKEFGLLLLVSFAVASPLCGGSVQNGWLQDFKYHQQPHFTRAVWLRTCISTLIAVVAIIKALQASLKTR